MKLVEIMKQYKCDKCKKTFTGKDVKLEKASSNIEIPFKSMMFVDKGGNIIGSSSAKEGDQTMHCPYCNELHLFGFDPA